jgi:integrase
VPKAILKVKVLDLPQRLPRPLAAEQVRQLEREIQKAITEAKTGFRLILAILNLACFYLLWHCGLWISEVCSLRSNDIDMDARKLFTTQHGALHSRSLQRRLVHYSRQCGAPVTA